MLDIGMMEIFVIGALALIVVGPKELPGLLRTAGQMVARVRGMAREFQRSMNEAAREADLEDVAKAVKSGTNMTKMSSKNPIVDSLKEFESSVKSEITEAKAAMDAPAPSAAAPTPTPADPAPTAAPETPPAEAEKKSA